MSRVPDFPSKRLDDPLNEIEQNCSPTTAAARQIRAEFIRDELARIGNEIVRPAKKA